MWSAALQMASVSTTQSTSGPSLNLSQREVHKQCIIATQDQVAPSSIRTQQSLPIFNAYGILQVLHTVYSKYVVNSTSDCQFRYFKSRSQSIAGKCTIVHLINYNAHECSGIIALS